MSVMRRTRGKMGGMTSRWIAQDAQTELYVRHRADVAMRDAESRQRE